MNATKATMIGLMAVLLWSGIVGLFRRMSELYGVIGGATLTYTSAAIILILINGIPKLSDFSRKYLFWGTVFFVGCEFCLALSIGYAQNGRQTIEVGMVNYLWPSLTILSTILFAGKKAKWWIAIGFLLSFVGISWVLGGGLNWKMMGQNILANPFSYVAALCSASSWAAYCTITVKWADGKDATSLFFLVISILFWVRFYQSNEPALHFTGSSIIFLLAAGGVLGLGYAVWNIGILYGNVTILAGASYFIPIFSAIISAHLLDTPLSHDFWLGASMVVAGSIVCWLATLNADKVKNSVKA